MATLQITVPDALVPRLTTAMRATYPQYDALNDVACFKQVTADMWRRILVTYEGQQANITAQQSVQTAIAQATNDSTGIG